MAPEAMPRQSDDPLASPSREQLDQLVEPALLEFGASWCGWCRSALPLIRAALAQHPALRHYRIEDGPGRRLGRSYGVKLWPTLILLREGREVARLVRPADAAEIERMLSAVPQVADER